MSPAKQIFRKLHLWFGLLSGLVVFIVAITGCLYAFQEEIQDLTQPYRFVEEQDKAFLPPSRLRAIADAQLPGKAIHSILYQGKSRAAKAIYYFRQDYYDFVYLNPYTGEVLKVKDESRGFFRLVLEGHFNLWLPRRIGSLIVIIATGVFVFMLISGIVLWWPKGKNKKQRFKIKWNARWRRKNYDLHNVIGFYASWAGLFLALTGLVWGFPWFSNTIYSLAGGEKSLTYQEPKSGMPVMSSQAWTSPVDVIWAQMNAANPTAETIEMHFPAHDSAAIVANINPDASTYWKTDYLYYDQYTLEELSPSHIWDKYSMASGADKMLRLNYDMHVGAVWGFPGKLLAFFASLMIASLPVTGVIIWIGRKKKAKKKPAPARKADNSRKKPISQSQKSLEHAKAL